MDSDIKEAISSIGEAIRTIEEKHKYVADEVVEIQDEIPANLDDDLEEIKSLHDENCISHDLHAAKASRKKI